MESSVIAGINSDEEICVCDLNLSECCTLKELKDNLNAIRAEVEGRKFKREWGLSCESDLEHLFLKAPQSGEKGNISFAICLMFKEYDLPARAGYSSLDVILSIPGGRERAPDVAFWSVHPTINQCKHTISEICPLPNVWVEIVYNNSKDRNAALMKIENGVIPHHGRNCSILLVALASRVTPNMLHRIGFFEVDHVSEESPVLHSRPVSPFLCYWAPGVAYGHCVWFNIRRNKHVDVTVPGRDAPFRLLFNKLVDEMNII